MGSKMFMPSSLADANLKQRPDLLRHARLIDIDSAARERLEQMCIHAGVRFHGLEDAALKRLLRVAMS